jgi:hypothetical protein
VLGDFTSRSFHIDIGTDQADVIGNWSITKQKERHTMLRTILKGLVIGYAIKIVYGMVRSRLDKRNEEKKETR